MMVPRAGDRKNDRRSKFEICPRLWLNAFWPIYVSVSNPFRDLTNDLSSLSAPKSLTNPSQFRSQSVSEVSWSPDKDGKIVSEVSLKELEQLT